MTYIRDPRDPFIWESDGVYNGKFIAEDGSLHKSPEEAIAHDTELERQIAEAREY